MNTVPSFNKYTRRLQALVYALRYPRVLRQSLQNFVSFTYGEGVSKTCKVEQKPINEITDIRVPITLQSFGAREGNVSCFELMIIASLVANRKPKTLLEVGTFDGTTALQMALNAGPDAVIHTIDLPSGVEETHLPILLEDMKFVQDGAKWARRYIGSSVEGKIVQHFGDSTTYDFSKFTGSGKIDFCFIDAGHTYECVKSDTENALKIMNPNGMIVWHDFTPNCPGVYRYLSELAKSRPLVHIAGTHLVVSVFDAPRN